MDAMKKRRRSIALAAGFVLAAALGLFWATRALFTRNEALLEDFITLCREEASQTEDDRRLSAIFTDFFDGALMCRPDFSITNEPDFPASPELRAAWERIQHCGCFTSVSCSFDENGALEVHFSAEGEWVPYGTPTEGHYCIAHCLLWRDTDYSGRPHANYWGPLGKAREQGGWYYTSHKHRDG